MEKPLRVLVFETEIKKKIRHYQSLLPVTKHSVSRKKVIKELTKWQVILGEKL